MKNSLLVLPFTIALLLTSCTYDNLYVQSTYITHEDLASYHVSTPDPAKECPDIGQRLLVSWSLGNCTMEAEQLVLRLSIRYGTQEERMITRTIDKATGTLVYDLINEEFYDKKGILTYLAEIIADGEVVEKWTHQIWTERIEFDS